MSAKGGKNGESNGQVINLGWGQHWLEQTDGATALAVAPAPEPQPVPAETIESQAAKWRDELVASIDTCGLDEMKSLNGVLLELTTAHPAGMVQLFTGRPTKLTSLFRDEDAYNHADARCKAVIAQLEANAQKYGAATVSLAIGVASWTESILPSAPATESESGAEAEVIALVNAVTTAEPPAEPAAPSARPRGFGKKTIQMPVLLHPVSIKRNGLGSFEISLVGQPQINPSLARVLRRKGALLDPVALAASASLASGFRPHEVLDRIVALGEAVVPHFGLLRRTIIGGFIHPNQTILTDFDEIAEHLPEHIVAKALAGDSQASAALNQVEIPELPAELTPLHEKGIGDLDHQHQVVLAAARTGANWFVAAPLDDAPGKLSAALVAEAASAGRSVLYVSGQRLGATHLRKALQPFDLESMLLEVPPVFNWADSVKAQLLAAMSPTAVPPTSNPAICDALIGVRTQLSGYTTALHRKHQPWGASPYDALQVLAELTSGLISPDTKVRLAPQVLAALTLTQRKASAHDLEQAALLGAFCAETAKSPWYGARVANQTEASIALGRVRRLASTHLPTLLANAANLSEEVGLKPARTMRELAVQLQLLSGMRASLTILQPQVFESSLVELIHATKPRNARRASATKMGIAAGIRLRKQAKALVKPGVRIADLSGALEQVESQREQWEQHAARPGWPVLPTCLTVLEDSYQAVLFDLKPLESVLASTNAGAGLLELELMALQRRLSELADAADALHGLPEREAALTRLRQVGLGDLVSDLQAREVAAEQVAAELELAWWGSVFEQMVESDQALGAYDGRGLADLVARFIQLDRVHAAGLATQTKQKLHSQAQAAVAATAISDEATSANESTPESLFSALRTGEFYTVRDLVNQFGQLLHRLCPVMVATPALVPALLPATQCIDLLVLEGIENSGLANLLPSLLRARQVIVIADPQIAVTAAVPMLQAALPNLAVLPSLSHRDPEIIRLLSAHGYQSMVKTAALPRGSAAISFDHVAGRGHLDEVAGLVDSTQEEVAAVVDLVLNHARTRAHESLAVVTLTGKHADAVQAALGTAMSADPGLAAYCDQHTAEPLVVLTAEQVAHIRRDAVVFTLGLGCTPHGRVVRNFGPVSGPNGERILNGVLVVARRRVHLVSCLQADDFEIGQLAPGGPAYLYQLLELAQSRTGQPWTLPARRGGNSDTSKNRLLVDIAERLRKTGCPVAYDYGFDDGMQVPLAIGHPDLPSEMLVAVYPDDDAYARESNLRTRERRRTEQLTGLGWTVTQLFSVAAFLDPEGEANRIYRLVKIALAGRMTATADTAPVPIVGKHERVDE